MHMHARCDCGGSRVCLATWQSQVSVPCRPMCGLAVSDAMATTTTTMMTAAAVVTTTPLRWCCCCQGGSRPALHAAWQDLRSRPSALDRATPSLCHAQEVSWERP